MTPAPTPTPFTVVGGFLGAGKTTLLNHLLANTTGLRCAVLVNDFGAINIDASLIDAHDGETMSLSNGCICCSLASGFIETLLRVTANRHRFDHVIVEASGVADPERIMDVARLDPDLAAGLIVVLVDAEGLQERLDDSATGDLVTRQLQVADLLLLNKVDAVSQAECLKVHALIQQYNSDTEPVRVTRARVPLTLVLDQAAGHAGVEPSAYPISSSTIATNSSHDVLPTAPTSGTDKSRSPVADQFHTASLQGTAAVSREALIRLDTALDTSVIRAKGLMTLHGESGWWSWQRVGNRSRLEPATVRPSAERAPFEAILIATKPISKSLLPLPSGIDWLAVGQLQSG